MTLTRRVLIALAAGGSAVLLAAAFLFQALGWAPCAMCLWQRWPHGAAIGAGVLVLALGPLALLGLAGALLLHFVVLACIHGGVGDRAKLIVETKRF